MTYKYKTQTIFKNIPKNFPYKMQFLPHKYSPGKML
jgi:hypothetical protein